MATLYELVGDWQRLYDMAGDPETEPQTWADTLEGLEGCIEAKAEGYGRVIRQLEADAKALKEEEDRLASRRKASEEHAKRMKQSLMEAMCEMGIGKLDAGTFRFSVQSTPPSVYIPDERMIPDEYLIEQPKKVDRLKIRDMLKGLKEGEGCGWASLSYGKTLRMR